MSILTRSYPASLIYSKRDHSYDRLYEVLYAHLSNTYCRQRKILIGKYIYIFGSHRLLQLKAATKRSGRIAHSVPIYEDDNIVYDICVGVCAVGTAVVDDTLCYDTPLSWIYKRFASSLDDSSLRIIMLEWETEKNFMHICMFMIGYMLWLCGWGYKYIRAQRGICKWS